MYTHVSVIAQTLRNLKALTAKPILYLSKKYGAPIQISKYFKKN